MNKHQELAILALRQMRGDERKHDIDEAIEWFSQQENDEIESLANLSGKSAKIAMYDQAVSALCRGGLNRAILLKPGYTFNKAHTIADVKPHELQCAGYLAGGVAVAFKQVGETDIGLDQIKFDDIHGRVDGCVVMNDAGLIAWIAVAVDCHGGELTIISNN